MSQSAQQCDILLQDVRFLTPDIRIAEHQDIAIRNGKIEAVCEHGARSFQAAETFAGNGLLWMPGLTDGHIHTSQQFLRGRLLDVKPVIWKKVNVPFESRLREETSRLSARLAAYEMLSAGTTAFVDAGSRYPEILAEEYEQIGMRGRVTVMTNDNPHAPESLRTTSVEEGVRRFREMKDAIHSELIGPMYSVTTPTAVSEAIYRRILEIAIEDDVPFETHLNEYASEVNEFVEIHGQRPFVWLEQEKLLPRRMLAAHAIFLSQQEIRILEEHKVRVIHCPFSNCGKGVPNTPELLDRGIACGFGSDGAGHGGLDLFREMRLFSRVMQVSHGLNTADSTVMPAENILRMATQNAAEALFMDYKGRVAEGEPADLIAIDTEAPHLFMTQNLIHALVESACGQDVKHSIIAGRTVMKNRELLTLDTEQLRYDIKKAADENPWLTNWIGTGR
ncbi:MAG: amidohydrolase family protein [Lachnospiraceae bacterium]|nr:amidohydrolase family protein [Lachnospiraceae bacterium]